MPTLDTADLEAVYDCLAEAIDRAGTEKAELFLVKLALLLVHASGDAAGLRALTETALHDL